MGERKPLDKVIREDMQKTEEEIEDKLEGLTEHDPKTQAKAFKEDARELIRMVLARHFPYFRFDEICLAIRKIS